MNLLKQKQMAEAIKRMKALGLYPAVIKEFEEDGRLNLAEYNGILFHLDYDEKEMIKIWEQEENSLVYHVIKTKTSFGLLYSLLYVSDTEEEWEMENNDVKDLTPFVYVFNKTVPEYSEFGSITILPKNGGLVRTN